MTKIWEMPKKIRSQWGHNNLLRNNIQHLDEFSPKGCAPKPKSLVFFPTPNREANARFGYTPLQPLQIFEFRILLHHRRTAFIFPWKSDPGKKPPRGPRGPRSTLIWCLTFSRYWCIASWHKQDNAFRFTHFPGSLWIANLLHVVGYWYSTWDKPIWDDFP
jgi:hypothetical protein